MVSVLGSCSIPDMYATSNGSLANNGKTTTTTSQNKPSIEWEWIVFLAFLFYVITKD